VVAVKTSALADGPEQSIPLEQLGERLAGLRLCEASALSATRRSLSRHGQLTALTVFTVGDGLEIVDGFKRTRAARELGWSALRVRTSDIHVVEAKIQIAALHDRRGLTELEEGWLVRSLYRDDHLSQPEIARRLERHKSWVCRRLILVEALDPAVQADVRLGLLTPRAAVALRQLPRGNQHAASAVVIRRGLTVRQTELFVAELCDCADETARAARIARWLDGPGATPGRRPTRAARSEADWIAMDIATLRRVAGRLEARLGATPLGTLGAPAAEILVEGLVGLGPVLGALRRTLAQITKKEDIE
jgi:ParB-like chromosome segregation protein Spo0J